MDSRIRVTHRRCSRESRLGTAVCITAPDLDEAIRLHAEPRKLVRVEGNVARVLGVRVVIRFTATLADVAGLAPAVDAAVAPNRTERSVAPLDGRVPSSRWAAGDAAV